MKRPRADCSPVESDVDETIREGKQQIFSGRVGEIFLRQMCVSDHDHSGDGEKKAPRGGSDSCRIQIIEKRRRDRINSSLSELRSLVPTASEKQGSSKLEKVEILQMTVDHLKMLQAAAGAGNLDGPALALDFLSLGFRECVTEVSRFLGAVEGLDPSSPLHSRLLSHLTSCSTQRDTAALKAASHQHPHPYPLPPPPWAVAALRPLPYGLGGLADSSSSPLPALPLSSSFPFTLHGGFPVLSSFACTAVPSPSSQTSLSSGKPYRPWGTEVGAL
ncbi:Hairy/enhancer-of-split related with YRPW motif protein 2 [Oryzias melastigma]|uniref:Hairy/enhancer-of-split related with YRPW motif protein 2 n=1 Tax=Oryzias melastigma TaxID=30732 RepID=A0A834F357_ORYME|nr:Hairy/enhancer-of-split related with YRPW motif protein 2 [Oryzias melastigma]